MSAYRIRDFLKTNDISISPEIQSRSNYPFTMACAKRFFENFLSESFVINEPVGSIIIHDGKENLPRHSYAHGFLFLQSIDEIGRMAVLPKPVGSIEFECGGGEAAARISVETSGIGK